MPKGKANKSTQRLTSQYELVDIPVLTAEDQTCWTIRCLAKKNDHGTKKAPVISALNQWLKSNPNDYKKILKSLKYAGTHAQHTDSQKVTEDREGRGGFEIRANRCKLRILFFYDEQDNNLILCTNPYSKGSGHHDTDQDTAFAICARIKEAYLNQKEAS